MSIIQKFSLVALLLTLLSCNKNNKFRPDYSNGEATAINNGQAWIGQARGAVNTQNIGIDLIFTVYNDIGELRQDLYFTRIPPIPGNYALYKIIGQEIDSLPGCSFTTISHDGDVVEDRYEIVEDIEKSSITVTSYDEDRRIIRGTFDLMLNRDTSRIKFNPDNPEMLHFEKGEFEVRIEE